jgi:hypothetical protein
MSWNAEKSSYPGSFFGLPSMSLKTFNQNFHMKIDVVDTSTSGLTFYEVGSINDFGIVDIKFS